MDYLIRPPVFSDGAAIASLVKASQTLDVNSTYLYFLLADHFSSTCAVAEHKGQLVGFVTAYRLPERPDVLFVWQISVDPSQRGKGLALALLRHLSERPWFAEINEVHCTISPSNQASKALFSKWADQLGVSLDEKEYLTSCDLGAGHEAEPLIVMNLRG